MLFTACTLDDAWSPVLPRPATEPSPPAPAAKAAPAKRARRRGNRGAARPVQLAATAGAVCETHGEAETGCATEGAAPGAQGRDVDGWGAPGPERLAVLLLVVVVVLIVIVTLALVAVMNHRMAQLGMQLHQVQYRLLQLPLR